MTLDEVQKRQMMMYSLTSTEASYLMGVTKQTVTSWIRKGYLYSVKQTGRWFILGVKIELIKLKKPLELLNTLVAKVLRDDHDEKLSVIGYGFIVDLSEYLAEYGNMSRIVDIGEALLRRSFPEPYKINIQYYLARAYSNSLDNSSEQTQWAWELPETYKKLVHLRLAIRNDTIGELPISRIAQIYTNLANTLSTIGRSVEALELWETAERLCPEFPMALGNRGYAYYYIARWSMEKQIVQAQYLRKAWKCLSDAILKQNMLQPDAARHFRQVISDIEKRVKRAYLESAPEPLSDDDYGSDVLERNYRKWCLQNHLVLNALSDLGNLSGCCKDVLHLPGLFIQSGQETIAYGLFNQIKQEYLSARYQFYKGSSASEEHVSDRNSILVDTSDSAVYSYSVERMKMAYRMSYSILDKIAFLISSYLDLDIEANSISLRTIWYQQDKHELRSQFAASKNLPLRALFWLGKDLFDERRDFTDSLDPASKELWKLRNHLEHKYVRIIQDNEAQLSRSLLSDSVAYQITRSDLAVRTIRLLRLCRYSMLYLVQAVKWEERKRKAKIPEGAIIIRLQPIQVHHENRK